MDAFEAACVLYRHGSDKDAVGILQKLWTAPVRKPSQEFRVFCALTELWIGQNARSAYNFLESVILGDAESYTFWSHRSLAEQSILLDWHGQCAFALGEEGAAFESLSRAASLGRDTSLIWRQLGAIYIRNDDLDLGLRYLRRSLQLYRQLDLDVLSGRDEPLGGFTGKHPLNFTHQIEDYLHLLLIITKLAKGQRNLRSVRELVFEMIHQFPEEPRLPKIRLLLERAIVESSLQLSPEMLRAATPPR